MRRAGSKAYRGDRPALGWRRCHTTGITKARSGRASDKHGRGRMRNAGHRLVRHHVHHRFQEVDNALNGRVAESAGATASGRDRRIALNAPGRDAARRRRVQDERALGSRADAARAAGGASEEFQGRRAGSRRRAAGPPRVSIQQGIPIEAAKEIVKFLKELLRLKRCRRRFKPIRCASARRRRTSCRRPCALREHASGWRCSSATTDKL